MINKYLIIAASLLCFGFAQAQTVSTFEELKLPIDTFFDGRYQHDLTYAYESGNAQFYSTYDTSFGGFWVSGIAPSTKRDTINGTYTNNYSVVSAGGYKSATYGVANTFSGISFTGITAGKMLSGMYVNNTFYDYYVMKNGNMFAKKFGGTGGNDPDWFKLTVNGYLDTVKSKVSVEMYLADFRFTDNSKDYIITNWTWLDLHTLGNVDRIELVLSSSDSGAFGYNTPLYVCVDNITGFDHPSGFKNTNTSTSLAWPNPTHHLLHVPFEQDQAVFISMQGQQITVPVQHQLIDVSALAPGMYQLIIPQNNTINYQKICIE